MPATSALSVPVTTAFTGAAAVMYAGLQLRVGLYRFDKGLLFGTKGTDGKEDAQLTAISRAGELELASARVKASPDAIQMPSPGWMCCHHHTLSGRHTKQQ